MRPRIAPRRGLLIAFATAAAALTIASASACTVELEGRGQVGTEAPTYEAVTLDGEGFDLAEYRGDVVLLNIWATWCPPCRQEMPHLQVLHETFRPQGLRLVGVSIDASGADRAVRQFLDELGVDFMVVRDPADRVSSTFGAYGVPLTLLIDRGGIVRWRHLGPVTSTDAHLLEAIREAIDA
jgi:peroxiredoxin